MALIAVSAFTCFIFWGCRPSPKELAERERAGAVIQSLRKDFESDEVTHIRCRLKAPTKDVDLSADRSEPFKRWFRSFLATTSGQNRRVFPGTEKIAPSYTLRFTDEQSSGKVVAVVEVYHERVVTVRYVDSFEITHEMLSHLERLIANEIGHN